MLKKIILFFLGLTIAFSVFGKDESRLTPQGCIVTAQVLMSVAEDRDRQVPVGEQFGELKNTPNLDENLRKLLEKEVNKVYFVYKGLTPEQIGYNFVAKCYKAEGSFEKLEDLSI